MADISKIQISDTNYDIKDKVAREQIEGKQDVLTPNDPLKIETYVKSNMVGMKYTDDLTGVLRNPANTGVCTSLHSQSSVTNILFAVATSASATGYTLEDVYKSTGYIDIPYTFGQVLNVGSVLANVLYRIPNCTLGKFVDGKYIPILSFRHSQNSYDYIYFKINPADELVTEVQSTSTTYIKTSSAQADLSYGTGTCKGTLGALIQLTQSSTGKVSVRMVYGTHRHTLPDTEIPAAYQSRLQEITTCRIAPTIRQGDTTPLAVAQIGLYNATSNITGNETSYDEWGPNQFDLSAVTAYNYLDLKVDNTTVKVNDDGNLSADFSNLATKVELNSKQDLLVSGTNIKTINGEDVLGSGDIEIKTGETITMSYDETNQRLIFGKENN